MPPSQFRGNHTWLEDKVKTEFPVGTTHIHSRLLLMILKALKKLREVYKKSEPILADATKRWWPDYSGDDNLNDVDPDKFCRQAGEVGI